MMRLLRGLTGLAVLAALAVGLPWALWATIGNPLDSWGPITAGQMGDREVMAVMAAVAYAAWASFAVALVVELIAAVAAKGSRHRRPLRLPLLGLQQNIARSLIAAVLLLLPTALTVVGPAASALAEPSRPAATASASPAPSGTQQTLPPQAGVPASVAPTAAAPDVAAPMYVIPDSGGLRSYWAIAEQYLGDGQRWQEIWQLNEGRIQDDGSVMDTPRQLHRGWAVALPGGASAEVGSLSQGGMRDVLVEPGDTLSGLAEEAGVADWTAIWPANANRAETGGEQLSDPDLIKPGWTISVPNDPAAISAPPPAAAPPITAVPPATVGQPTAPPVTVEQRGPVADPQEGTVAVPVPLLTSAPTNLPTTAPTQAPPTAPTTAAAPSDVPDKRTGADAAEAGFGSAAIGVAKWSASIAAGAGLLAASALLAMRRYRRRQFRNRDAGRAVRSPEPQHVPLEKALVTAGGSVRDVQFIDRALRALAGGISDAGGRLPAVVAARLTDRSLDLVLADAQAVEPPAPWVAASPTSWAIEKDSDLPDLSPTVAAPYPTLISLGHTPAGEEWLVDLEQAGAVTLDGDPDRCMDLMRFAIAELAHNVWADHLTVTLAGFGAELVDLNPERVIHSGDIVAAAASTVNDVAANRDLAVNAGIDVLQGRLAGISGDAWMPKVLIVAPGWAADETDAEAVRTLIGSLAERSSRTAVAVILPGDRPSDEGGVLQVTVLDDGTLLIPSLDVVAAAHQLPDDQAGELAEYLAAARHVEGDAPMPAADDALSDLTGALLPEHVEDRPAPDADAVRADLDDRTRMLPLPIGTYLASTATTVKDVHALAPAVAAATRDAVRAGDPELDADIAAWHGGDPSRPRLQLLGQVLLTAPGAPPEGKTAIVTEAIAYLALHPRGVTGDRFAADFWPGSEYTIRSSNPRNTLSLARSWLGTNPVTGEPYLPYAKSSGRSSGSALYRLDGLWVDADLFRRLRTRAATRGPAGHDDLVAALQLVQGCPLNGLRPGGGSWLADHGVADADTLLVAIVEVAHLIATRALADGDTEQARWAAQTAIDTGAADDRPLLDLAATYDVEGRAVELAAVVRRVKAHHDAAVEEDMPKRTYEVLLRRGWLGLSEVS